MNSQHTGIGIRKCRIADGADEKDAIVGGQVRRAGNSQRLRGAGIWLREYAANDIRPASRRNCREANRLVAVNVEETGAGWDGV